MILIMNTPVSFVRTENPAWLNYIKFDLPPGVTMTHPPAIVCETKGCEE